MIGRDKLDGTSNEELARLLYRREAKPAPDPQRSSSKQAPSPAMREPSLGTQQWSLGQSEGAHGPLSERERRALFAALSKGTRANVGRDPAVAELLRLVQEVQQARALVAAAQDAIVGRVSIHMVDGQIVFRGPASERLRTKAPAQDGSRYIRAF